jgi:hypothetical protein
MEAIFAYDLTLCKSIIETLNLPNEQLVNLTIRSTDNFDHLISILHKDIPWGPDQALPNMFCHPQIKEIKWLPLAPEPRYDLLGNPQAVYLMIRRRLYTQLQYIINRVVQQLDFLFLPAPDYQAQTNTTTPLSPKILTAPAPPKCAHTPNQLALVITPPLDRPIDADSDTGFSHSPVLSEISSATSNSTESEDLSPPREFTTTQTQTDDQVNQLSYMVDSPWAWLDN